MHKILVVLITVYCLLFTVYQTALAISPVIIHKADPSYPQEDGNDQDYLPSNPYHVKTVPHPRTVTITQSFHLDPITSGTQPDGDPEYATQTIDQIEDDLDLSEYTNFGLSYFNKHVANRFKDPFADQPTLAKGFKSYSIDSPVGSSNLARRTISGFDLKCLKGQRLITAIRTLNSSKPLEGTTVDVELTDNPRVIRISEVGYALRDLPIFYNPDLPCNRDSVLESLSGKDLSLARSKYNSVGLLSPDIYLTLYRYGLEPVDDNTIGSIEEQCDLNDQGQKVNCKKELRGYPYGSGPADNGQKTMNYLLPYSSAIISKNYGDLTEGSAIPDRPNPLSFLARFFRLFFQDEVKNPLDLTFSGPTVLISHVDQRVEDGLNTDVTAITHLFPKKDLDFLGLKSLSGSSTDNQQVNLDPAFANAQARQALYYSLTPRSWR